MPHAWMPGEPGDDELERLFAEDREAWRGELHRAQDSWAPGAAADSWRGTDHLADWPAAPAGPEYWMYKRAAAGDDERE
jgi:hypothetical protein